MNKRIIIRVSSLVVILFVCVFLFFIGKQHTILVDNKTVTISEQVIKGYNLLEIKLDRNEEQEMSKNERIQEIVVAQKHKIKIIYTDNNWKETEITTTFKLPLTQRISVLSIPLLIAFPDKPELWLTEFK